MSICPACNTENLPGMVFCVHCGGPLEKDEVATPDSETSEVKSTLSLPDSVEVLPPVNETNADVDSVIDPSPSQSGENSDRGKLSQTENDVDDDALAGPDQMDEVPSNDTPDEADLGVEDDRCADDAEMTRESESNENDVPKLGDNGQPGLDDEVADTETSPDETAETNTVSDETSSEASLENEPQNNQSNTEWSENIPDDQDREPTFENEVVTQDDEDSVGSDNKAIAAPYPNLDAVAGRLSPLAQLPGAEPGPISPLQLKDGGEAIYGERWWLRPETIVMVSGEKAVDEKSAALGGEASIETTGDEQPKVVRTPRSVIELDRRRFDELPTLEETEKKGGWALIVGVVIAAIIGVLIFTQ